MAEREDARNCQPCTVTCLFFGLRAQMATQSTIQAANNTLDQIQRISGQAPRASMSDFGDGTSPDVTQRTGHGQRLIGVVLACVAAAGAYAVLRHHNYVPDVFAIMADSLRTAFPGTSTIKTLPIRPLPSPQPVTQAPSKVPSATPSTTPPPSTTSAPSVGKERCPEPASSSAKHSPGAVGYCYIGADDGGRVCVPVADRRDCTSDEVFESADKCRDPAGYR